MIKALEHKKMNKKAIFFTILAISLLSLFIVSYSVYSFVQNREGIDRRIKTLNSFVSSLEKDVPRKLYISGYRIIFLFNERIVETGDYINNIDAKFSEAFFDGEIEGVDYRTGEDQFGELLYGSTYSDIVDKINEKAKSLNVEVKFNNPTIEITQDDPWHVKVSLKSDLLIQDKGKLAKWEKASVLSAYIPIESFEDPLYIKNTNAMIVNKFKQTTYALPILGNDLLNHAENSYYIAHADAPSFLQRLKGDLSADPYGNGIESLVNTHELSSIQDILLIHGITVQDKCIIDYVYFDPSNNPEITATYNDWIKLCGDHSGVYGGNN